MQGYIRAMLTGSLAIGVISACSSSGTSIAAGWEGTGGGDSVDASASDAAWPTGTSQPAAHDSGADGIAPVEAGCSGRTGLVGDRALMLTVGGGARTVLLHVPSTYDPSKPTPLVTIFHGFVMNASMEEDQSQMIATSDARGFVVAFPQGMGNSWNAGDCCGQATATNVDDIGFFEAILAKLEAEYCIDTKRVYVAGFSNGGFFAHRLACELSEVVAAIAPVSGVLGMPPEQCTPRRPVPVLEFHGTADIVVPFNGGTPIVSGIDFGPVLPRFRSVAETNRAWRDKDDCLGTGDVVLQHGDASCSNWKCAQGSEVELCTIDGGGHTWPGGHPIGIPGEGKVSASISASDRIADFFARHALP